MAKTTIGIKNISGSTLIITDLVDVSIATTTTVTVSDNNGYSEIKSSQNLYDSVNGDSAFIVIDGVEQDKASSLRYLQDNTVTGGLPSEGGADIPQIKGASINFLPFGNTSLTAGVNQTSTKIKGIPFNVSGNMDSTGIVLQVSNTSTSTLHLALYKYDYSNDIWNIASEQMDINISATGVISQDFTVAQSLTAGKYCVAFKDSTSTGQILGFYKNRSQNNFGGNFTSMTGFYNTMQTGTISYSPTMPATITFSSANFLENAYHEVFQIKF